MKKTFPLFLMLILSFLFFSCTKEAGEGGNSTIFGKIITYNYNAEFTHLRGIYPGADEDVYITYGSDHSYSQRIRSNYDGVYEFKYLRTGDYTIYVYSKDSTLTLVSGIKPVIQKVTIDNKRQTVEAADMKIFR